MTTTDDSYPVGLPKVGRHPGEYYPDTPPAGRGKVLDKAKALINGERRGRYGEPEDSFATIAALWTAYLQAKGMEVSLTARDVGVLMGLFKIARDGHGYHDDNLVDCCGYIALAGDMDPNGTD